MLLKRKLISQFEKADEELNASISKVSKTMESIIGNAMQQYVGVMGGLMMQHFSPYQYLMNNQNIQTNANNVRRPNYNAGYDTAQRNFSTFVDEVMTFQAIINFAKSFKFGKIYEKTF